MSVDRLRVAVLVAFALVCAVWGARTLVEPDAIGLVLAIDQQDVRIHQPPPPGFILYVWVAQFTDAWINEPWLALRIVAVLALGAAAVLTASVATRIAGARAGGLALVTFLGSPLVLFHGMTASSFPGGVLIAALAVFLCLRAVQRGATSLRFESYLLALCTGLRAQALLVALPLWIWMLVRLRLSGRQRAVAVVAWLAGMVCWLVPQAKLAGSLSKYWSASWDAAWAARSHAGGWAGFVDATYATVATLLLGFGVLRLVVLALSRLRRTPGDRAATARDVETDAPSDKPDAAWRPSTTFWLLAVLPTLFWELLFSRSTAGALLVLWPALCVTFAVFVARARSRAAMSFVAAALALDVALFFVVPLSALRDTPRLLEAVEFFHERVRTPTLDSVPDTLAAADIDPEQALVLSTQPVDRALAYTHPEMFMLHVETQRPEPRLVYHERRARAVHDTYEVDDRIQWVAVHGRSHEFSRAQNPLLDAWPQSTRGGLHLVHVGRGPIDAWYVPDATREAIVRVHLVRGLPPSDPDTGAIQRAERAPGPTPDPASDPTPEERDVAAIP